MKKKSLKLNALLNSIRSILNILFPIVTFPYVSRVLQVKGLGIYNFSNSIISYFILIAALGINTYAIREGARIRDDEKKITKFSSEIFTINVVSTIISYLLLAFCLFIFSNLRSYFLCISIFSIQIFFATIGTEWIYQIYEDYAYITIRSILFQIISICLLFIFVKDSDDYLNYAAITVFSVVGSNILNFIHARQYCHIRLVWRFNWMKHLLPILIIFGANIANMFYVNSDITLLGLMKSNYVVGIYSVSSKVYQIVQTLISALLIVTVPRLAMLFGNNKIEAYKDILSKLTNTLVIIALPAATGLFMLAKEIVLLISGPKFLRAISSLQILCFAYIFAILAWILTDCVLIPAKREKFVLGSMGISAGLNIGLNLILIPYWNENAAAISTVLAELCMFLVNYHYGKDLVRDVFGSKNLRNTFITSLIGCVGIVVTCLFCNCLLHSMIWKTFFSILLSSVVYILILILLRNAFAVSLLKQLREVLQTYL